MYVFYNLSNKSACFIIIPICFNNTLKTFWFYCMIWLEILTTRDFLIDSIMSLSILQISTYISKSSLSGLILIISHLRFSFKSFLLFLSFFYLCLCVLLYQLLLLIYVQENTSQCYILKQNIITIFFRFGMLSLFLSILTLLWSLVNQWD